MTTMNEHPAAGVRDPGGLPGLLLWLVEHTGMAGLR